MSRFLAGGFPPYRRVRLHGRERGLEAARWLDDRRDPGWPEPNALIGPNSTKNGPLSRFEIEDPAAGSYVLIIREGDANGEIPFNIG